MVRFSTVMQCGHLFEMIRKIIFTNYFAEIYTLNRLKLQVLKGLSKKCFQSDTIFRHCVKMGFNWWIYFAPVF